MFEISNFTLFLIVVIAPLLFIDIVVFYCDAKWESIFLSVFLLLFFAYMLGQYRLYLLFYPIGSFLWIPIYWYLYLLENRHQLMEKIKNKESDYIIDRYGIYDKNSNTWIPKNPKNEDLVANGILWPIAMPIYFGHYWIDLVIKFFSSVMRKIQLNLSVKNDR